MKQRSLENEQRAVENFNKVNAVGCKVKVRRDDGSVLETVTRSEAQLMDSNVAVIWIEGIAGCYSLHRVRPVV